MGSRRTKITKFKENQINQYTGGKISSYEIPDYEPLDAQDDGKIREAFVSQKGEFVGDFARGWWYVQQNLIVYQEYAHGVAIVLKDKAMKLDGLDVLNVDPKFIEGYYGFSHRGGQTFRIGDKIFDATYEPVKEDYSKEQWQEFLDRREEAIQNNMDQGWCETREQAEAETPLKAVIPYVMRGKVTIENWDQAIESAINISKDLS